MRLIEQPQFEGGFPEPAPHEENARKRAEFEEIFGALEQGALKLEELATKDELTGLDNKRGIKEKFAMLQSQLDRGTIQRLTLMLVDLDNFKKVNDTMGHITGDAMLKGFGETMLKEIRGEDIGGRWGGEEFLFVFVNATPEEIRERFKMEDDEKAPAQLGMIVEDAEADPDYPSAKKLVNFTVSGGIVEFNPAQDKTLDQAVDRADKILYVAKRNGRNQILTPQEAEAIEQRTETAA